MQNSNDNFVLAIDIGGTKIDLGIVDHFGEIYARKIIPTPDNPNIAVNEIVSIFNDFKKNFQNIKAIGIGAPNVRGGVNGGFFESIVVYLPKWSGFNLKEKLCEVFKIPVIIENDADAATMGAFLFGYEKSLDHLPFLYLTVSTGTGGGLIISNKNGWELYRGNNDEHPEFGHIHFPGVSKIGKEIIQSNCNIENCLDSYIGGRGIQLRYGIRSEEINEDIKDEIASNLAKGLFLIGMFYGPKVISLGGGVINGFGESFINLVKSKLAIIYSESPLMTLPNVVISNLRKDTGLLGAAAVGFMVD
jgi:glucokinase